MLTASLKLKRPLRQVDAFQRMSEVFLGSIQAELTLSRKITQY